MRRDDTSGRREGEAGNLLLAMLAVIMVAGLVATLFAYVTGSTRQTRSDRDFQSSVLGADAGVEQALVQISSLPDATTSSLSDTGSVGDVDYAWTATRTGGEWEVVATGTNGESDRTFEATIVKESRFMIGAFADVSLLMRGSNGADSYNASNGATDTGFGSVGSNGVVDMLGSAFADVVYLYGDATCARKACDQDVNGNPVPFDVEGLRADMQDEIDAACPAAISETFRASSSPPLVGGTVYCFANFDADIDVVLSGASPANPVVVYLTGNYEQANGVEVNCAGCLDAADPELETPASGALQVYSLGTDVSIGNQGATAAAIAAPNAACQGNPSNAQAEIYGAMICSTLGNQGGWNFHFDQSLLELSNGFWDIDDVTEEIP